MNSILENLQFTLVLMLGIVVIGGILVAIYKFPIRRKQAPKPVDHRITPPARIIPDDTSVGGLLAYTKDWNGYRREEAIRRLDSLDGPGILVALIERLNDWVPEVRQVAKTVFFRRLESEDCTELVNALPNIYQLAERSRDNHQPVICAVEKHLIRPECSESLIAGLNNSNIQVARACYDLLLYRQVLPAQELLRIGFASSDWHIRRGSLECLNLLSESEIRPALSIALRDKFPPIRRIALRVLLECSPSVVEVVPFLFDRNISIREIAIKHLKEYEFPIYQEYKELLQAPNARQQVIALWGVTKTHHEQAVDIVTTKLDSQFISVRREALECLAKLDEDKAHSHIIAAFFDDSPGITRTAIALAKRLSIRPRSAELDKILKQSYSSETLQTCIELTPIMDKWEALEFFFLQIGDDTSNFQGSTEDKDSLLKKAVSTWSEKYHNLSLFAPYPKQRQALEAAIDRMPPQAKAFWQEWFEQLIAST
ncbi:HEAT repeat domain-containing protein [Microbulbifer agarilyticus]|uniref:HEAT repeat domain-containing protein n=1 Tax=Microbulbifer agarilyticus TaxID=260552 RepID=UPI001C947F34|nr:HEAT repeat domain-containing protein [Microbulbifer agarilyticus]MBY6213096.1 HEAT repeat domain-containing protein [Microbulbifer agarilyticus]